MMNAQLPTPKDSTAVGMTSGEMQALVRREREVERKEIELREKLVGEERERMCKVIAVYCCVCVGVSGVSSLSLSDVVFLCLTS